MKIGDLELNKIVTIKLWVKVNLFGESVYIELNRFDSTIGIYPLIGHDSIEHIPLGTWPLEQVLESFMREKYEKIYRKRRSKKWNY